MSYQRTAYSAKPPCAALITLISPRRYLYQPIGGEFGTRTSFGLVVGRSFIGGANVDEMAVLDKEGAREFITLVHRTCDAVRKVPAPTIARIEGHTLGAGIEFAAACDIRIANEKARFGQPEINLGIIPGGGGTQRLTRLIGEGKSMEMILSGDMIDAQTALNLGLVNHVYAAEELETKTLELASKIAEKSPIALQLAKEAVKLASRSNLDEGLRREVDLFAICFSTEDKVEGVAAFLEKRKPVFKGK